MSEPVYFVLSIDRVVPDVLIENRRAYVFFSLTNNSGRDTSGVVLAQLYLGAPYYIPTGSTHWAIQLGSELTASGVVAITPPFAGKGLTLVLQYRESGSIVAQSEISIEVAARFDIGLASFIPEQIRSNDKDTVVASVSLIPANKLGALSAVSGSVMNVIGGVSEIPFPYPPTIKDIDVVPGSEPRNTVLFSYVVLNNGHGPITADQLAVLNELSDTGDAIASVWVPGDSMQILNKRMHDFHQALFDGCDGLLAADRIVLTGRQLIDWTGTVDGHREMREYTGEQAPIFCSGKASLYKILFFVHRQRQPNPSEFLYVAPEFSTTRPNGSVVFTTDPLGTGHIDPNVTWWVEGAPDIYGKMAIPSFPAYTAPADADWRIPVIIHAVHKDGRKGIAFVRVLPDDSFKKVIGVKVQI